MTVQIDRVIQVIISDEDMEKIWKSEKLDDFWADYDCVADNDLDSLLTPEELSALAAGNADYIAFRLAE